NTDRLKFQTKDAADIATFSVTYDPLGFSGWHTHPGIVFVVVQSGSVVRQVGCASQTYDAGGSFIVSEQQPPGQVRNPSDPPRASDEGIRAAGALRETYPSLGVVVLSQYSEPAYAIALLDTGSDGRAYLLKDRIDDRAQLVGAIRAVAQGGSYVDPKVVERL